MKDREAWCAAVHGVTKSLKQLSDCTTSDKINTSWCCMSGEGNGNPLQYSCLENPMDGGAGRLQFTGSHRVGHD